MHPDDAEERGIEEGDQIRAWNALGEMRVNARITPLVKRGIVAMPKGVWRRNTRNGYTTNALVPDTLTDLGGGACFTDARVQVEKVASSK
jgi:anaerobic selenocysteine-containing dehydrogenase